ncbi:MAG: nickel-dependent hydrogenase large subunit, partial [Deltaproteobacteria bacterium]|nr:nickel-dependent hydrogenase large subunit [Deltaproteobacteria bacterium]
MKRDVKINVEHITRVEGHGNIVIDIKNGRIKELRLEIVESPRFYEAMVMGRRYEDVPHIVSRICGICAVSHTSASLK